MAGRNDWETPRALVDACERAWGKFDVDVCASAMNAKAPFFFTVETDGLRGTWQVGPRAKRCWMNPPYTVGTRSVIGDWVDKAIVEANEGAVVVALLINDPSTKWFKRAKDACAELWFLEGPRIRFEVDGKPEGSPTQSHVVMVLRTLQQGERKKVGFWDWHEAAKGVA